MGLFLHRIVELSSFFHDFLHGHLSQYIYFIQLYKYTPFHKRRPNIVGNQH